VERTFISLEVGEERLDVFYGLRRGSEEDVAAGSWTTWRRDPEGFRVRGKGVLELVEGDVVCSRNSSRGREGPLRHG